MQECGKADHAGMQEIQKQIAMAKAAIRHVDDRQNVIHETISKSKRSFLDLLKHPEGYDLGILEQERLAIRPDAEAAMRFEIEDKTYGTIQEKLYTDSLEDAEESLTIHEKQQSKKLAEREEKEKHKKLSQTR
jgi:KaiC/GvpD/RAD55 family RecA-like ATPase